MHLENTFHIEKVTEEPILRRNIPIEKVPEASITPFSSSSIIEKIVITFVSLCVRARGWVGRRASRRAGGWVSGWVGAGVREYVRACMRYACV